MNAISINLKCHQKPKQHFMTAAQAAMNTPLLAANMRDR
jgi:hypothetical protein